LAFKLNFIRPFTSALIFIGALSLYGCNDQVKNSTESETPLVKEVITSKVEAIISDDTPEPQPSNPTQLITDLGFSETQTTPVETKKPETKLFCLDKTLQSTTEELRDECLRISDRLASVSLKSCLAAKLKDTGCKSVSNND